MMFAFFVLTIGFILGIVVATGWLRRNGEKPETEALERYRRSQVFSKIGSWDWELKTDALHWSDEVYQMFGYQPGEITPTYELFCNAIHPEDRQRVREAEEACMQRKESHDIEYRVVWHNGTIRWLREAGNVLADDKGQAVRFTGTVRDVTVNRREVDRIRQLAHYDALTGLANRTLFESRLDEAIGRAWRHSTKVALVYMDLNKFKPINDSYGHGVGDKVLVAIAGRLTRSMRTVDTIARVGGDEFVAILEDINSDVEVRVVAEKLRGVFSKPFDIDGRRHQVGVSIGVSLFPEDSTDIEELIHIADQAMYQSKNSNPGVVQD